MEILTTACWAGSGVLTAAGQAYVQMPVHDTNLFYRIPGRLQAERYVTITNMNIAPTTDVDGLADMISTAADGSVDYNIQVDSPGSYLLNFRVAGAIGQIRVFEGSTLLGAARRNANRLVHGSDNCFNGCGHPNTPCRPACENPTFELDGIHADQSSARIGDSRPNCSGRPGAAGHECRQRPGCSATNCWLTAC